MKIKINDTVCTATIKDTFVDFTWDNRESKLITLEMDSATASSLFVDDVTWGIVHTCMLDPETGESVETVEDMSEYCVAGSVTDNRDGTCTVKMGKLTDSEALAIMMGGN